MKNLTGIERTMRALNFQDTDRIPVVGGLVRRPEFLAEVGGVTVGDFWKNPRKTAIAAFRKLGADLIVGPILPNRDSKTGSEIEIPFQSQYRSPEDVVAHIKKLPPISELRRNFDARRAYKDYLSLRENGQRDMDDMLWVPVSFGNVVPFELSAIFGMENYLLAIALYPEHVRRLFEYYCEGIYMRNIAIAEATVKENLCRVMLIGQDICDNRGPMVSPEVLDDIYFPFVKKSLSPLKEAGIRIIWHSDGNIMPIVPQLINAGVDGFQGFQESVGERVDLEKLSRVRTLSGEKVLLMGSISTITVLPFGTTEDVRHEVERCIRIAENRGGGFLLASSSSIGPEVPAENIHALFNYAVNLRTGRNL